MKTTMGVKIIIKIYANYSKAPRPPNSDTALEVLTAQWQLLELSTSSEEPLSADQKVKLCVDRG
jgi:hypothetical protein